MCSDLYPRKERWLGVDASYLIMPMSRGTSNPGRNSKVLPCGGRQTFRGWILLNHAQVCLLFQRGWLVRLSSPANVNVAIQLNGIRDFQLSPTLEEWIRDSRSWQEWHASMATKLYEPKSRLWNLNFVKPSGRGIKPTSPSFEPACYAKYNSPRLYAVGIQSKLKYPSIYPRKKCNFNNNARWTTIRVLGQRSNQCSLSKVPYKQRRRSCLAHYKRQEENIGNIMSESTVSSSTFWIRCSFDANTTL